MAKRRLIEGSSYWMGADPMGKLANYDALRETTGQARAQARGERFIPFEERPVPSVPLPVQTPQVDSSPATPLLSFDLLRRANGDNALFASGLKILLAVLTGTGSGPISLSQFAEQTGLSKGGVIGGIRNALDCGYLTRSQSCPRCETPLPFTEDQKTTACPGCHRSVAPQAHYALTEENNPVHSVDSPVQLMHRAVQRVDSPVHPLDSPPVLSVDSPVTSVERAVQLIDSPPVQSLDREAVHSVDSPVNLVDSLRKRTAEFRSRVQAEAVHSVDSPVNSVDRSHMRADSDSESNITNDSVYMRRGTGNGNTTGKSETEQLAQASCKALETGVSSLGMHIKAWAHARSLDAKTGTTRHQEALAAIQRELGAQRRDTGQPQGKAWTRRVCDYFEGQGQPLSTTRKEPKGNL